ncbi:MAG: protoheme IX farnesyltransferase [Chloroflexi bacterium]|nr:protoheme IX farnesyltransferase [Chloroflexota bacterium]
MVAQRRAAALIADYITLTKPRIVLLLLVTAVGGMLLAAKGLPSLWLVALVLVGGMLAAGGANALNHCLDRDIDELMRRTRQRPVAARRVPPVHALVFGVTLNVVAFVILAVWVNMLSAALALSATLFYILVYTRWLKRSTPQGIVIGGAAGAVPPVVGWAAVTGHVGLPALYLFAIVFFWTPPHFWSLALMLRDDYARAQVPMLPVVRGLAEAKRSIFLYSIQLVVVTLLFAVLKTVGNLYLSAAVLLDALLLWLAWRLLRSEGVQRARPLYLFSLLYLALLFAAVMLDSVL